MVRDPETEQKPGWFSRYVIGLALGALCAAYGVVALLMGRTFLPGLRAADLFIGNRSGRALAAAYLLGGLFLIARFYVRGGDEPAPHRAWLYWLQNLLLAGFVGTLGYVLFNVGTLH